MAFSDVTVTTFNSFSSSFQEYCSKRIKKFAVNYDFKFSAKINVLSINKSITA